ncbi:MAG: 2-C-methyl-D-erythritol 2,4-cyclodiphosphate synthase [Brevinematales bacterium]|nr:2-C-methyl-D-erythritol 2,4-cyclodiphosphate synthase [Brevinematales bacterium]
MYRVGQGFDIHKLVEGKRLILGGVEIPNDKGSLAHSDGDVLLHSITDALLGAIGERDIGYHFPDTSPKTKDIGSSIILLKIVDMVKSKGYSIVNLDSTIIANKPKLQPYVPKIRENISKLLEISQDNVSIKAKTTEGFFFRDDGLMVFSVVLLTKF